MLAIVSLADLHAHRYAKQAADGGHDHGFGKQLRENVALARAGGHANADFRRALGHRHQHDVHRADAAREKGDSGYRAKQYREGVLGFGNVFQEFGTVADTNILTSMKRLG